MQQNALRIYCKSWT